MSQAVGSRLALISAPPTPAAKLSAPTTTPTHTPSPGTWRHPRYDEIARRQKASTFDASNVQRIVINVLALIGTWTLGWASDFGLPIKDLILRPIGESNASWAVLLFRITLIYNVYAALRPLYRAEDTVSDIPLTPTQRSLLGLDPTVSSSMTTTTPTSSPGTSPFITPPRYRRSVTPRSGGAAAASGSRSPASYSASPLARKASLSSSMRQPNGSPSPSTPSALWRKTLTGSGRDLSRRHSYGSSSPLGTAAMLGNEVSAMGVPATPSPTTTTGRGASVALNNKWLYEKGRASPGRSIFS